ncbi:MAG: response regulator [Bdellovibrionales bacterium]|nr:response regulator [Bdellovibrionales bacterium]
MKKKKVLIIDDSKTIQKLLKHIITSSNNFEVMDVASSPSEARKIIEANKPDLITLDIHMSEMDGWNF